MKRRSTCWALCAASVLMVSVAIRAGGGGQQTPALLDAHLRQAQQLTPPTPQDGAPSLHTFQQEMLDRVQQWEDRFQDTETASALLAGIPDPVLRRATAVSQDTGQTHTWLAADASLPVVLALVALRSPEVRAARENLRAVLRRFGQAAYLEELITQFRAFVRELDTKVGPQTHKEMPEKTFAFPSILALKGQLVDIEAAIAELRYQRTLRMTLNETARTYFEAQYAHQAGKILHENRALFTQMDALATARLRVGQVSQSDSLKTQAELAMVETQLATIERQRLNAIARINATLLLPPGTPWAPIPGTDLQDWHVPLEHVLVQVRQANQEVHTATREVELMTVMIRMAESEILPRGSQGYSQFAPSTGADAGPTRSMMATFPERPEVNANRAGFGANVAYLEELRVRLTQAHAMERVAMAQAEFTAKDAHFRADAARRERQTFAESVVPKTRLALETVRENYNAARVPFIEYLDAARSYLKDTLALEKARLEHNQMLGELQDRMGLTTPQILPGRK
jgi:outer membrane protein, heavy metal efflux system